MAVSPLAVETAFPPQHFGSIRTALSLLKHGPSVSVLASTRMHFSLFFFCPFFFFFAVHRSVKKQFVM